VIVVQVATWKAMHCHAFLMRGLHLGQPNEKKT
jgi:hypothetical protein